MRKDVKLGLAVGGVLVAVLIVYVLVVPGAQQPGAELATAESGSSAVTENADAGADAATNAPPAPPVVSDGSADTGETEPDGQTAESGSNGEAVAQNKSFDWDKLLNGEAGSELPSMSAQTPVQTAPAQTPTVPVPPAAPTESASEPDGVPPTTPPLAGAGIVQPEAIAQQQPTTPATPPAAPARVHIVQPNETLSSIAAATYGSPNFYPHIQRANPSIDPTRLKPGMKINLPDVSTVKPAGATVASHTEAAAIDPNSQYRVQPNDSLYLISIKLYGKSDRADKLYEINKETIGENPAKVKPGMVLKLPESPTVTASSR